MTGHVGVRHGKRGDSWYFMIYLGRDPRTGKKKYDKQRGFATEEEAQLPPATWLSSRFCESGR